MLFNSFDFAIFFPAFCLAYFALRKHIVARNLLIVAGSYLFYGWWDVRFLRLIIISTAVDYLAALLISRGQIALRTRLGVSTYVMVGALILVGIDWSGGLWSPRFLANPQVTGVFGLCATAIALAKACVVGRPAKKSPPKEETAARLTEWNQLTAGPGPHDSRGDSRSLRGDGSGVSHALDPRPTRSGDVLRSFPLYRRGITFRRHPKRSLSHSTWRDVLLVEIARALDTSGMQTRRGYPRPRNPFSAAPGQCLPVVNLSPLIDARETLGH